MVKRIRFSVPREIRHQTELLLLDMALSYGHVSKNNIGESGYEALMCAENVNKFFKALYGWLYTRKIDGIIVIDEVVVSH